MIWRFLFYLLFLEFWNDKKYGLFNMKVAATPRDWQSNLANCQQCVCGERNEEPRIVGGSESQVNAYPWLARLIYHKSFGCGAALITDRHVVTAAHCVKGFMWSMFRVTFGEHERCSRTRPPPIVRFLLRIVAQKFALSELSGDIAVLLLNQPVIFSHQVRPVCLPSHDKDNYAGRLATVAGWGATGEGGKWSCSLQEAEVPVLTNQRCQDTKYNVSQIKETMMCAGYPETAHIDACTGDSGGPLIIENKDHLYELIGIVSWGYGCARVGYPGVYTRVTKYLDWIKDNTKEACYCTD